MTKTAMRKIIICLLVLGACIAAALFIDSTARGSEAAVLNDASADEARARTSAQQLVSELIEDEDASPERFAKRYFSDDIEEGLPADLAAETLDASAFEACYSAMPVLGLIYDGPPSEAANTCEAQLEARGWLALDKSEQGLSSFAKASGIYHWLTLQYLSVANKTAIVVHTS